MRLPGRKDGPEAPKSSPASDVTLSVVVEHFPDDFPSNAPATATPISAEQGPTFLPREFHPICTVECLRRLS